MIRTISAATLLVALAGGSAFAQPYYSQPRHAAPGYMVDPDTTGSIIVQPPMRPDDPVASRYSTNPGADGNARQINKPVPNYGTTSEGNRAFYE